MLSVRWNNLLLGRGIPQASKDWLMDGPLFHQKKQVKTFGDNLKNNKLLHKIYVIKHFKPKFHSKQVFCSKQNQSQ